MPTERLHVRRATRVATAGVIVCGLGWTMPVREVVKAGTRGVMPVRLSEVETRWSVGGRLRHDVEGAEALRKPPTLQTIGRRSGLPVAGFADDANFAERDSFAV